MVSRWRRWRARSPPPSPLPPPPRRPRAAPRRCSPAPPPAARPGPLRPSRPRPPARPRPPPPPRAPMVLGQLYYARGEYRRAAETFGRAAARLDPGRKPEARYWAGLAWLALGDANQARAALDEVVGGGGLRHTEAMLAQVQAW